MTQENLQTGNDIQYSISHCEKIVEDLKKTKIKLSLKPKQYCSPFGESDEDLIIRMDGVESSYNLTRVLLFISEELKIKELELDSLIKAFKDL